MKRLTLALGLMLLAPTLGSCGGAATPADNVQSGSTALGKSDWRAAQTSFEAALAALAPTDPSYKKAKMGQVEALIQLDAARAQSEFLAYAQSAGEGVDSKDWRNVMTKLTAKGKFAEAIAVLDAGLKSRPQDADIKKMGDAIKVEAEKAGDANALGALAGLGYL
jgi:hypothetical protein